MKTIIALCVGLLLASAVPARGQQNPDTLIVITVPLKYMESRDAVMLLHPYATSPNGGVFPVPGGHAVTIREKLPAYGRMLKMLAEYDKPPAELSFTFQLIVADNSGARAPEIASLDSLLRGVLKFTGYKLLGVGIGASVGTEGGSQTIVGDGKKFTISYGNLNVRGTGSDASVAIQVNLVNNHSGEVGPPETILRAGVTVPIGQTVVLGSAALDNGRAIIVTVRPQFASPGVKSKDE